MAGIADRGITVDGRPYCPAELTAQVPAELAPVVCASFTAGTQAGGAAALQGLDGTRTQPGLVAGANGLAQGAAGLSTGATKLATGVSGVHDGATQLATGAGRVATGTEKLAAGLGTLTANLSTAATGVTTYVDGVATYSRGVDRVATGIATVADRSTELGTGLTKAADQIPTYDEAERTRLSSVVAEPIGTTQTLSLPTLSSTSLLVALALFAGALITFLVARAVPARSLLSGRSSAELLLAGLAPAAVIATVQAVVLTVIARAVLDLGAADTAGVLGLAVLGGVAFVAVGQALVVWAGHVGRLVGLAAVALAAAGGLSSAVPGFFAAVRPFLPTTPLVDGIRALLTDGPGLGGQVGVLALWLLAGLVVGVVGVARQRVLTPRRLALVPALA